MPNRARPRTDVNADSGPDDLELEYLGGLDGCAPLNGLRNALAAAVTCDDVGALFSPTALTGCGGCVRARTDVQPATRASDPLVVAGREATAEHLVTNVAQPSRTQATHSGPVAMTNSLWDLDDTALRAAVDNARARLAALTGSDYLCHEPTDTVRIDQRKRRLRELLREQESRAIYSNAISGAYTSKL